MPAVVTGALSRTTLAPGPQAVAEPIEPPGPVRLIVPVRPGSVVSEQGDLLAGGQADGVAVAVAQEVDRAHDGRVVDQAAGRILADQRRGIGLAVDLDDVAGRVGGVADPRQIQDRVGRDRQVKRAVLGHARERQVNGLGREDRDADHGALTEQEVAGVDRGGVERLVELDDQVGHRGVRAPSPGRGWSSVTWSRFLM